MLAVSLRSQDDLGVCLEGDSVLGKSSDLLGLSEVKHFMLTAVVEIQPTSSILYFRRSIYS